MIPVGGICSREISLSGKIEGSRKNGQIVEFQMNGHIARLRHFKGVTREAETGDVRRGFHPMLHGQLGWFLIEGEHAGAGGFDDLIGAFAGAEGGGDEAGAEGFGEDEHVARNGGLIGHHAGGINDAGNRQAVLHAGVAHGMSPHDDPPRCFHPFRAAFEDFSQHFQSKFIIGKGHDVESGFDAAAHGEDIAHGVGGGDLAVDEGIVDEGGEEVEGLDDGGVLVNAIDAGIAEVISPDEQVGIGKHRQVPHQLGGGPDGQFARSARAGAVVHQSFFASKGHLCIRWGEWWFILYNHPAYHTVVGLCV